MPTTPAPRPKDEHKRGARALVRVIGSLVGSSLLLCAFSESSAWGGPDRGASIYDKLRVSAPPAGRLSLTPGTAKPYADARRALAKGEAEEALALLKPPHGELFADREALVRGDALLALGDTKGAHAAYAVALERAVVPAVAWAAVRSLAETHAELDRQDQAIAHLDALMRKGGRTSRRLLAKARLLEELATKTKNADLRTDRRTEALALTRHITLMHPASREARGARDLQNRLVAVGAKVEPATLDEKLEQASTLLGAGRFEEVKAALEALPGSDPRVRLLSAHFYERQGHSEKAKSLFLALSGPRNPPEVAAEALGHRARQHLRADENEEAAALYDALVERAPDSARARKAEFLAAWIPYDAGRYPEATKRMLRYATHHRRAGDRDEALWYAGWSSYLGGSYAQAKKHYESLLTEHERSSLVPHVHYWLGRIALKEKRQEDAKLAFRKVLALAPLSYYGLWATWRLEALGEAVEPPTPPRSAFGPSSVETALKALGRERPITVDRAILLSRADRQGEAIKELESSSRVLRRQGDPQAQSRVADLLHQLGAHHLGFKTASSLTRTGAELQAGEPEAWLAWRHAYPRAFEGAVDRARNEHEVAPSMVWAIMRTESHYRPWARSRVGARGLMQLMPATARQIGRVAEGGRHHAARFREPESNIWLGSWYLANLIERYGGQLVPAVGAYNGGPRAMDRWLETFDGMPLDEFVERIPYRETRRYVRRVVETWAIYTQLYSGKRPSLPPKIRSVVDERSQASF